MTLYSIFWLYDKLAWQENMINFKMFHQLNTRDSHCYVDVPEDNKFILATSNWIECPAAAILVTTWFIDYNKFQDKSHI